MHIPRFRLAAALSCIVAAMAVASSRLRGQEATTSSAVKTDPRRHLVRIEILIFQHLQVNYRLADHRVSSPPSILATTLSSASLPNPLPPSTAEQ